MWAPLAYEFCLLLFLISAIGSSYGDSFEYECLESERKVLQDFMHSIPNFNLSSNWTDDGNCCNYLGVTCKPVSPVPGETLESTYESTLASNTVRVVELSLFNFSLNATIPPVLSNLTYLQQLNLSWNHFRGNIPREFISLAHLQMLDLSHNNLSGNILLFESMPSLQLINISQNDFSGRLPVYRNVSSLKEFIASNNHFSGTFPTNICQHAINLSILNVAWNDLSGGVNQGLGLCTHLQQLDLSSNSFTGPIPDDIYIGSLSVLRLQDNSFTGTLAESVGNLHNLSDLILCNNNLSGTIPKSLSQNTNLRILILSRNNFSGSVEVDFSKMTNLLVLDLNSNSLSGPIPSTLAKCTLLRTLSLSKNKFTGTIPSEFKSLINLTTVSLSTNQLHGGLQSLQNCQNLVSLILTKNFFNESLPAVFDGFRNVQVLALGFLNLSGRLPAWLQHCKKLQVLDLSWNQFRGDIPPWLGSFQHLTYLELSNNSFTGAIPLQLFSLISMMHNDTNTTGLHTVESVIAVKRQVDSPDLTYNQAQALPTALYLSNNYLVGPIPAEIGRLKALVRIDLSHNQLAGNIPASFAEMLGLESLDLSFNHLNGTIPTSLTNLTFMASFNVSYNNLSGRIPVGNQFATFSSLSYEGNSGLCGFPLPLSCSDRDRAEMPPVMASLPKRSRTILVAISVSVGVAILLVAVLICLFSGRTAVHQGSESSRDMHPSEGISSAYDISVELFHNHQKLTVGDLLKATNNFDSANIVGCGGFGLVYRADLGDGSRLAIKKLTGDGGQMEREFRAEVDALSKAQHKNLVSLQGYLHIGNEKLLIYSFMENGSLDYWLHERNDGGSCLDWPTRLKIAQGAAAGLAYLHQVCDPHIVHRDIKSSNILLDEKFEAHLADFGLARLLMSTETHVTTELVGTLGYIPPEYGEALNATTRGDVYSFGVVLLELLTGKRPVDICKPRGSGELVTWVLQMRHDRKLDQIFDKLIKSKGYEDQMQQVLDVACLCINRNPLNRPAIKDIVIQLSEVGSDKYIIK